MEIPPTSSGTPNFTQAAQAEKQARERIAEAEKSVQHAEQESSHTIDHIRDEFERQRDVENARQLEAIENERNQGYGRIRDLRRNQQAELRKTQRDGEDELRKLKDFLDTRIQTTDYDTKNKIHDEEAMAKYRIEDSRQKTELEEKAISDQNQQTLKLGREHFSAELKKLDDTSRSEIEKMKESSDFAKEKADALFTQRYEKTIAEQQSIIENMEQQIADQAREIRKDTSEKISAYSTKTKDPFYRLMDLNAKVHDQGDHYLITLTVPEYEQKNISALVKGNTLVIAGHRQNQEALNIEQGHKQTSSGYQSFQETFTVDWPPDPSRIARESDGDELKFRIAKRYTKPVNTAVDNDTPLKAPKNDPVAYVSPGLLNSIRRKSEK